ncbi:MAG: hypothetical protein E6I75_15645 [Chloroflexi bacterium]|nr:MAG: hypothetical protein E6I75_15645 [Chloroflexota bacterium]
MLALVLPFEAIPPVVASLTDEKLVLLLVAVAWAASGARARPEWHEWRALLPSLVLVLLALVSALQAPDYGDDALRFVWRLIAAAFVLLVTLRVARDPSQLVGLLWAIAIGAGASALLGLGEALNWSALEPVLRLFKVAPTRVGGELRAGASFQYATIAAMYFEMVAPLAIVLAATARRRVLKVFGLTIAVACTANVVLSLTRAAMLSLALTYVMLAVLAFGRRDHWRSLRAPMLVSAAVLIGGVALLLLRNPVFDLRLVSESDAEWYGAAYSAPATLSVQSNQMASVAVDVRNEGRITWVSSGKHPFALGYRWLSADGTQVLDLPPAEVPLPGDVSPGDAVSLRALIQVPNLPAGTYRIDWGMLQRDVLQFYERGWADAWTLVSVNASSDSLVAVVPSVKERDDGEAPWVVGRLSLWGAAIRMIAAHPLLGVGPDNFRHFYGAELGLESWDERVQANNLYLEVLADVGVLGLAAFLWVIVAPLVRALRALRAQVDDRQRLLILGVMVSASAFLLHGLLDSFLAFTPTALLFWALLGVLLTQKPHVSGRW